MQDEMISALVRQATDPVQYDHGNIDWIKHGTIANPLRIFFFLALYMQPSVILRGSLFLKLVAELDGCWMIF